MRISDWSSDVCSSDLGHEIDKAAAGRDDADPARAQRRDADVAALLNPERIEIGIAARAVQERPARPRQPLPDRDLAGADHLERPPFGGGGRSEEHTSELHSLMRISYASLCLNTTTKQSQ